MASGIEHNGGITKKKFELSIYNFLYTAQNK